jgi:hypothetical protein
MARRCTARRIYCKILRSFSNANPAGGIKPADNAAFGVQPQGYGVANRAAATPGQSPETLAVWPYRGQPPARGSVPIKSGRSFAYFDAFSSRQPASASLENAYDRSRNRGHIAS